MGRNRRSLGPSIAYDKLKAKHEALERRYFEIEDEVSELQAHVWQSSEEVAKIQQLKKERVWTRDRLLSLDPKIRY